jgi:hypothetical protein
MALAWDAGIDMAGIVVLICCVSLVELEVLSKDAG